ncbi:MAG: ATP-dependent DNA helicase Rep [Halieaceae bacterium]|jgi:ATP-dependent DNA helicase Rep
MPATMRARQGPPGFKVKTVSKLNKNQREAVKYIDGPLLVLAGAGSGKTSVITQKIAYLVEHCGIAPRHIAAVTFTNKAAREMQERVSGLLGKSPAQGPSISTFHRLGLRIIRSELKILGLMPGFSIFDGQDSQTLIKDILREKHGDDGGQADHVLRKVSTWKNDLIDPVTAIADAKGPADMLCAQAYKHYQRGLRACNAMDFDDLISLPCTLFAARPDILLRWQQRIRYLLVDEYQDTNNSQYQLVRFLVGLSGKLTVVGDDDQSIYAWRGARPENLELLQQDYPGLKVVKLEQNYRSTARLLRAANQLISNNPHIFTKELWCEMGPGEPLRVIHCDDEEAEADQLIAEILDHQLRHSTHFSDYAVLYRGNHQARLLELKMQANQVPYEVSGGTSFFARSEIKDVMAYLRLLVNPADDSAFFRVANVPRRQLGTATMESLGAFAQQNGLSMLASCGQVGGPSTNDASRKRLRKFFHWFAEVSQQCQEGDAIVAIRRLLKDINYRDWLEQTSSSDSAADRRWSNVEFLIENLARALHGDEDTTIEEAIERLILRDLMEQQEDEEEASLGVQMMTLHASKGLEFHHVYLVGMEENILPHRTSIEEDSVEEERRLAYVGITRAQRSLTMLLARKRRQYGGVVNCEPSRFLDELPVDDLAHSGRGQEDEPGQNESRGRETLAGLQNLFA